MRDAGRCSAPRVAASPVDHPGSAKCWPVVLIFGVILAAEGAALPLVAYITGSAVRISWPVRVRWAVWEVRLRIVRTIVDVVLVRFAAAVMVLEVRVVPVRGVGKVQGGGP